MSQTVSLPTIEVDPKDLQILFRLIDQAPSLACPTDQVQRLDVLRETVEGALAFPLDTNTGFPVGWHGTGTQAIKFAMEQISDNSEELFFRHWNEGSLAEWPEYYDWLKTQ